MIEGAWTCNECGSAEYSGSISEDDIHKMTCGRCGSSDWHWEDGLREIKHEGFSTHRLADNPMERLYAEAWKRTAPGTLGWLLGDSDSRGYSNFSERDAKVAASIIQWLGSPVGSSFVAEVLNRPRQVAKRLLGEK